MSRQHPDARREAAVAALRESAGASGVPKFEAVAQALGVARSTLHRWWTAVQSTPGEAVPIVAVTVDDPAAPDRGAYLVGALERVRGHIVGAVAARSWTAVAALERRELELRNELDRLRGPAADPHAGLTREERLEQWGEVLDAAEDAVLELALDRYGTRHGGRILFVSEGWRSERIGGKWVARNEGGA